ncbi:alpha-methylacyl-CoA racemase [uncultured Gammaproteobacteria bacterium]
MPGRFLAGFRVLDLSQYIPGPYAAQVLADLGAEVIKVEPPAGDPMRNFELPDSDGLGPCYKLLNAGKTVIKLDLKTADGQAAVTRMLAKADVLVESYRPGTLGRLGLSRARLEEINPRLVHVAISGWGQGGPYRLRAGHDVTYAAVGGGLAISGTPETPVLISPPMADYAGAQQAIMAVLAGLVGRERSGKGSFLDVSLMETVLGWQGVPLTMAARGQSLVRGESLITGGAAWYRIYKTADGRFVAFAPIETKFWQTFCGAVNRPDWLARHGEPLPQTGLIEEISALFASQPLQYWQDLLDPVDCCFEAILDPGEVINHPHVVARGQVVHHGGAEPLVETLLGLRVDGGTPPHRKPVREAEAAEVLAGWGLAG